MADAVDRLDHRAIDRVVGHVLEDPAVDLEEINGQMLQIGKRGHAGPKVVQREAAAQRFHCVDEVSRLVESGDGGGLCNLEADGLGPHRREVTELLAHVIEEALVADRAAGDIDGAYLEDHAAFGLLPGNGGERGANDPAVDRGHQIVAFRRRDERHGRHQLAAFVEQAQQDFAVRAVLASGAQALDVLRVEHEPIFLERLLQPADPFHLALAHRQVAVLGVIQLHAVAAQLRGAFEREGQATLEFGAIYQAGQGVVTRLVGELGDVLAFAADVVHDQDHADDLSGPGAYRGGGLHDRNFRTVVAHQQHGGRDRDGALLAQYHFDRVGRDIARGFVDGIDDAP